MLTPTRSEFVKLALAVVNVFVVFEKVRTSVVPAASLAVKFLKIEAPLTVKDAAPVLLRETGPAKVEVDPAEICWKTLLTSATPLKVAFPV